MDDNQFDKLVQRLTSAPSRREAVAGLVAGAITSVGLTSVADAKRQNKNQRDRNGGKGRGKKRGGGDHRGRGGNEVSDEKKNHNNKHKNKHKRCRKVGRGCSKNNKCCSKFCDPNTGLCASKPDS